MHLYPINGACHRVGPNDTAFAYRKATAKTPSSLLHMSTSSSGTHRSNSAGSRHSRSLYDQLVQVKRKYDPGNLFHINQNIKP